MLVIILDIGDVVRDRENIYFYGVMLFNLLNN